MCTNYSISSLRTCFGTAGGEKGMSIMYWRPAVVSRYLNSTLLHDDLVSRPLRARSATAVAFTGGLFVPCWDPPNSCSGRQSGYVRLSALGGFWQSMGFACGVVGWTSRVPQPISQTSRHLLPSAAVEVPPGSPHVSLTPLCVRCERRVIDSRHPR